MFCDSFRLVGNDEDILVLDRYNFTLRKALYSSEEIREYNFSEVMVSDIYIARFRMACDRHNRYILNRLKNGYVYIDISLGNYFHLGIYGYKSVSGIAFDEDEDNKIFIWANTVKLLIEDKDLRKSFYENIIVDVDGIGVSINECLCD